MSIALSFGIPGALGMIVQIFSQVYSIVLQIRRFPDVAKYYLFWAPVPLLAITLADEISIEYYCLHSMNTTS